MPSSDMLPTAAEVVDFVNSAPVEIRAGGARLNEQLRSIPVGTPARNQSAIIWTLEQVLGYKPRRERTTRSSGRQLRRSRVGPNAVLASDSQWKTEYDECVAAILVIAYLTMYEDADPTIVEVDDYERFDAVSTSQIYSQNDWLEIGALLTEGWNKHWFACLAWAWKYRHRLSKAEISKKSTDAEQSCGLKYWEARVVTVLASADPIQLLTYATIEEAMGESPLTERTIGKCVRHLIELGLAERLENSRYGVRLTAKGRELASRLL